MKDFELYQQVLGLVEPWRVESVTLKPKEREIEVRVSFAETLWGCPQCQERMQIHDCEERRWRHLDSCQFKTMIVSRVPVVMPRLCVDEKGIGNGQDYLTIVAQVQGDRTTVQYVGEKRERESLDGFWESLTAGQLAGVEAVAMDMWEPYMQSTLAHVPGAAGKIVHDPFHLVKAMNEAVNDVRKDEHRRLLSLGDDILKGTRQLWLYGMENVPAKQAQRFEEIKFLNLQTSRAWAIKEVFRSFWLCDTVKKAEGYFDRWYSWAIRSRLDPVKKVARTCKTHLDNILTFFKHRLTNGPIEGLNNAIQGLIKKAFGYRNKERFKTDIFFHFGGLDLYPAQ